MEGVFGLLAVENLLDGEDLEARVGGAVGGFVKASFGGFFDHGFGGFFKAEEDAHLGFLAAKNPNEVADLRNRDSACLDGKDDLLRLAGVVVVEVEAAINAAPTCPRASHFGSVPSCEWIIGGK